MAMERIWELGVLGLGDELPDCIRLSPSLSKEDELAPVLSGRVKMISHGLLYAGSR